MSNYNIFFFSNNCEPSKLLLSMFDKEKLTQFFHLICTDNNRQIPEQIKVTPTIIIRGHPPYVANDAFSWFSRIKQWKISTTIKNMNSMQQEYLKSINNNLVPDDSNLLGFNATEMSGMSDIFSFFSKDIAKENQNSLPQSYFDYNDIGVEKIFTPPLEDGSYKVNEDGRYKISEKKQAETLQNLEQLRNQQEIMYKNHVDEYRNQFVRRG